MSIDKNIIKNLSWLVVANALTKPLWFVYFIFVTNVLGVIDFGIYTYTLSILTLFGLLIDFGLDQALIREIAQKKEILQKGFSNILSFKILASIVVFLLLAAFVFFLKQDWRIIHALVLTAIYSVISYLFSFCRAIFRGVEKIKYEAISIIIEKFGGMAFSGLFLILSFGLQGFLVGMILGNLLSLLYCLIIIKKLKIDMKLEFDFSYIKEMIIMAFPFILVNIFIVIYFKIASVLLMFITGSEYQVGLYNTSSRLVEMFVAIPTLIMTPIYPVIARTYLFEKAKALNLVQKTFKLLFLISISISVFVFFNYESVYSMLFKDQFKEGALGLKIMIISIVPISINSLLGTILAAIGKQKFSAIASGMSALITPILNFILIAQLNYVGASIATTFAEILITILNMIFVIKFFGSLKISIWSMKFFLIGIISCILVSLLNLKGELLILNIFLYSMILLSASFMFKIITPNHLREYYKLLIKK